MQGEPLPTITRRHLITRNGNKTERSHVVLQLVKNKEVHVLCKLSTGIVGPVQVFHLQVLEQITQRIVLVHWTTTAKNKEQHRNLDELVATFSSNGVLHHLQHGVNLLVDKELLVLHVLGSLVPIALPLLSALLW